MSTTPVRSPEIRRSHDEHNWWGWALPSLLYVIGLAGTSFDPPQLFATFVIHPLGSVLWPFLAWMIVLPLFGLYWFFPAIPCAIAFNCWGTKFIRARLCLSSVLLAGNYFLGNGLHFKAEQWYWLHTYMCGILIATGSQVPRLKASNWIAFAMLALAIGSGLRVPEWRALDHVWGIYFLFVSTVVWVFPMSISQA